VARLRARGQLNEVRLADLRFSTAEVKRFLVEGMGLELSPDDLALLVQRTEGWAAGIQLAGLSLQGRSNPGAFVASLSGANRFILDYLTEEVLALQPSEVQAFLLHTAVLERLTGELCDAVTGQTGGAEMLEHLQRLNLFVLPLDDEGRWYRYHHLFGELLRARLARLEPQLIPELHHRAAAWHEAHGLALESLEHTVQAADWPQAARLLEAHAWELLNQGHMRRLETWLQTIPPEQRSRSPRAYLSFAWMYLLRGVLAQSERHLGQALNAIDTLEADEAQAREAGASLRAEALALQANLLQAQGRLSESLEAANTALALGRGSQRLAGLAHLALGGAYRQSGHFDPAVEHLRAAIQAAQSVDDPVTEMLAVSHLSLMSVQYGRLHLGAETAQRSLERLERTGRRLPPIAGAVWGALGQVYSEWDRLDEAAQMLERGIELGKFSGHNASTIYSLCNMAGLRQSQGDLEEAARLLAEANDLLAQGAPEWVRPDLLLRRVALLAAQARLGEAEALLSQAGFSAEMPITHQSDSYHLAHLQVLAGQQPSQAHQMARRIAQAALEGGRVGTALQALLISARLAASPAERQTALMQAYALAEPQGYVRRFLDAGFSPPWASRPAEAPPASGELINALSEREIEVLRLLAEGLTYAQAAEHLVVSVNTVRYHVKSIYLKLGVNKLAQAIDSARRQGLLTG
jgi:LuxR family maltose regulon positive regulatory protein